ncbi:SCO4225 family membrane protein [Actinophytocola sediminis]
MAPERVPWRLRWFGIWYLVLVIVVAVATWGWLDEPTIGASFGGIWLHLVCLPTSHILVEVDVSGTGLSSFTLLVAAGVTQGVLLLTVCWWLDRRSHSRSVASTTSPTDDRV